MTPTKSGKKKGRALEKLVAQLERTLAKDGSVRVESPKRLRDRTSGQLREHDVLLTIEQSHHSMMIAIECRNRSRKVGSGEVEAFWKKCQDTGVSGAAIVSPRGFTAPARKKADFLGIRCLDLNEVGSVDWLGFNELPIFRTNLMHIELSVAVKAKRIVGLRDFTLINSDGEEISREQLLRILRVHLPTPAVPTAERFQVGFNFGTEGLSVKLTGRSGLVPVTRLTGTAHFESTVERIPFRIVRYSEQSKGTLTHAAVARVEQGPLKGDLMIVFNRDSGGELVFVPEKGNLEEEGSD